MAFGQKRTNSYILMRSSAGKSKKRKRSDGAGDGARETARDGARDGYLDDTADDTTLAAVDELYIQLADEFLRCRGMFVSSRQRYFHTIAQRDFYDDSGMVKDQSHETGHHRVTCVIYAAILTMAAGVLVLVVMEQELSDR